MITLSATTTPDHTRTAAQDPRQDHGRVEKGSGSYFILTFLNTLRTLHGWNFQPYHSGF